MWGVCGSAAAEEGRRLAVSAACDWPLGLARPLQAMSGRGAQGAPGTAAAQEVRDLVPSALRPTLPSTTGLLDDNGKCIEGLDVWHARSDSSTGKRSSLP